MSVFNQLQIKLYVQQINLENLNQLRFWQQYLQGAGLSMPSFKQNVVTLIKKLQFNPIKLGGETIFTTTLGIIIGAIIMTFVMVYAVGKFSVIQDTSNVVSNSYMHQNDPYQVDLQSWDPKISIFQNISRQYVTPNNMLQMGLNVTAWNLQGQSLQRRNPSKLIAYSAQLQNMMTINNTKTPFNVSGSNYVPDSPYIKQYLIQIQFCSASVDTKCNQDSNRFYTLNFNIKPKWAHLLTPKQSAIKQMSFVQKIKIDKRNSTSKYQYTYDVSGFNVTSDTSLLPSFFPRTLSYENGSSLAGPPIKIFLPQQQKNIVQIHFRRSQISHSHTTNFNSIDTIFAQILGIIALFGLVLYVLFGHYSKWGSQQFILKSVEGSNRKINFAKYLKFYLTCKSRSKKQQTILKQAHQNIIQSYKQRKKRKIQIEVLKLRVQILQKQLKIEKSEEKCKEKIFQRLQEEQKDQLFSSSILTQQIRNTLLNK